MRGKIISNLNPGVTFDVDTGLCDLSNSMIENPAAPSPYKTQTSEFGLVSLALIAKPAPTPRVPKTPGSNQLYGLLG